MAQATPPDAAATIDDYRVDRQVGAATRPTAHVALSALNVLLLIVIAAISFSLFWVVATLLGVV